jgi:membrane protein
MEPGTTADNGVTRAECPPEPPRGPWRLVRRVLVKAWNDNIVSESAEAAFWQTLSLPPLLLGLLGSLGFVANWFGASVVATAQHRIVEFCGTVFSPNVVHQIIEPTVADILNKGHGEIVSIAFLISLWAGSSAMASFIDAITVAHGQYGVRNAVWQRSVALFAYMAALVIGVVTLPMVALGPGLLATLLPSTWEIPARWMVGRFYYPTTALILVLALTTLYKIALPRKLPWRRLLPGAGLAMVVFLLSSGVLRYYLAVITSTGYSYGALATPIAFLLFTFCIGLAIVLGAHCNNAIQEFWPARMTERERRRWRRLEHEHRSAPTTPDRFDAPSPADIRPTLEIDPVTEPAHRPGTAGTSRTTADER